MPSDLNALLNVPRTAKAGGEELTITPVRVGELPQALALVAPIIDQMLAGQFLVLLAGDQGERTLDLVALLARKPRVWVNGLELDEAMDLMAVLIEVNADFFARAVLPRIAAIRAVLPGATMPDGSSTSNGRTTSSETSAETSAGLKSDGLTPSSV